MPPRWPSQTLGTPGQVEKVDCQVSKPLTWTPFDPFCPPCPKLHHDTETPVIYIPPVTGETEATVTWWGRREEEKEWVTPAGPPSLICKSLHALDVGAGETDSKEMGQSCPPGRG